MSGAIIVLPVNCTPSFAFLAQHDLRAVVFDWDGVVVDSAGDYYRAYELTLHPRGILTTPHEVYLLEGMTTEQVMTRLYADRGQSLSETAAGELARERRDIYSGLARNQLFPGVWDLITGLHAAGYRIGVVTGSTRPTMKLALPPERERYFGAIVTGDSVTFPKPHPEPFLRAFAGLGVPPERCLVVENAPFGVQSAQHAGARAIALCTTLQPEDLREADWIVRDHAELRQLLNAPRVCGASAEPSAG